MEFTLKKKEAFIVTQKFHAGTKNIPLGSIGCFVEGRHKMGCIVDLKSRPVIALVSSHIKALSLHQAALLLTIESLQKRYSLLCNEQLFTAICSLQIHDVVQLRCDGVVTVGIVRGFWERLRKPGNRELKMVLIEVELLVDPKIIDLGNRSSRLKVDASKIIAVSSSVTRSPWCKATSQGSHKKESSYLIQNLADDTTETVWEQDALQKVEGFMKGIQGHCNSCYLDTTLFSLFSFSTALDGILYSAEVHDTTAQEILRQQIVQPLRQYGYVRAENVMNLRRLLQCDSFITEEKDPEEFLNALLGEVLAVEPLLKIRSENEILRYNCYQVLAEKDDAVNVPTVQQVLEKSMLSYNLKFAEIPSCLILQMPRFGKAFKTFSSIYPSLELDLTDVVEQTSQAHCVCDGQVTCECSWCHLDSLLHPSQMKLLRIISKVHSHQLKWKHSCRGLKPISNSHKQRMLELFAVLCIENSHYVAFVRCGPSRHSWLFFDSMAGTLGTLRVPELDAHLSILPTHTSPYTTSAPFSPSQTATLDSSIAQLAPYLGRSAVIAHILDEKRTNIPMVIACPQLGHYLAMTPEEFAAVDTKQMDEFSRRFFCEAYTFMYQQPNHSSYKYPFRN